MAKKYKVKKKLKIKNIFILLTIICTFVSVLKVSNFISGKENQVLADNIAQKESQISIDSEDIDEEKAIKDTFKVIVDASYGGSDGGSKGYNGIIQKNINLEVALKIKSILERHDDIEVILTREDDSTVSLSERLEIINNSEADLLVSIMQNNEGTGEVSGVESYVLPKENANSNTVFGYILQQAMTMYIDTKDRGVLARNMDILLKSNVPGAVVNTGFISNKEEGTNLSTESYQLRMAEGIAQGILSYIDRYLKK